MDRLSFLMEIGAMFFRSWWRITVYGIGRTGNEKASKH